MSALDGTVRQYRDKLEHEHGQFLDAPTVDNGWELARAVEEFLEVYDANGPG